MKKKLLDNEAERKKREREIKNVFLAHPPQDKIK